MRAAENEVDHTDPPSARTVDTNLPRSSDQDVAKTILVKVAGRADIHARAVAGVPAEKHSAGKLRRGNLADIAIAIDESSAEDDADKTVVHQVGATIVLIAPVNAILLRFATS